MEIAFLPGMLIRLTAGIKRWLSPAAASQTILIEGGILSTGSGTPRKRSLSAYRMRVQIPGEFSYGVEYRVADRGEFRVTRGIHGGVVVRNKYDRACSIPVCWLSERFLGKDVDRYIIRIDGEKVNFKAGLKDRVRVPFFRENGPSG